ncbi:hepatoma-derived growth factor-related protein 2 [Drosophila rhopaloa]|uniref:PWWP domain-containing protein n=1 Tax=Drosophila rhopaloa TaxID=1041015 RepID=A0ABM5J6N1_DRORH|nr:hepatoma-derived growth factor-related protein 2 [Drosophila rhopaloa]
MGRHRPKMPLFTIGDFVFAKVRGYRAWPARILDRVGSKACNVYFYGTCNHAKVPCAQIFDFERHVRRLGVVPARSSACNPSFRGAMLHARQAFENPEHDVGYYQQLAMHEGNCVNAEDLRIDYMVDGGEEVLVEHQAKQNSMEEGDSQGHNYGDQLEEQDLERLNSKTQSKEQVAKEQDSMDQLEEHDSQLEEQHSKGINQQSLDVLGFNDELGEQNSNGINYNNKLKGQDSVAQFTALNSKKPNTNHQLKEQDPENRKKQLDYHKKDTQKVQLEMKDSPIQYSMPLLDEFYAEEHMEEHYSEAQIPKDQFEKPYSKEENTMPQLDGLNSDSHALKLEEEIKELLKMLMDIEEQARKDQDQNLEKQHLEEFYAMDQPLNLTCRRRSH